MHSIRDFYILLSLKMKFIFDTYPQNTCLKRCFRIFYKHIKKTGVQEICELIDFHKAL